MILTQNNIIYITHQSYFCFRNYTTLTNFDDDNKGTHCIKMITDAKSEKKATQVTQQK